MPRPTSGKKTQRHAPLHHQIDPTVPLEFRKGKTTRDELSLDDHDIKQNNTVSGRMSKKVLQAIKAQQLEIDRDHENGDIEEDGVEQTRAKLSELTAEQLLTGHYGDSDDDDTQTTTRFKDNDDYDLEHHEDDDTTLFQQDEQHLDLNPEDRAMLEAFLPSTYQGKQALTSTIITNAEQREATLSLGIKPSIKEGDVELKPAVPKEVIVTYKKIGQFLSKYRSGKLPKAFKVIPTLRNWEEIMYYTNPADWTPQATNAATKLFSAALKPKHAQRFYSLVIAPKVSAQLATDSKLGYHLYDSLRRAIWKPTAFFKGLILPIAAGYSAPAFPGQPQAALSKEVIVYASILNRIHIPQVHAAVTLLQMSKIIPFNPYNVLLMKVLIDKKFALPIPVIEGLLAYFYETAHDENSIVPIVNPRNGKVTHTLPLLWHRCLLHFVQRYKDAFTDVMVAMVRAIIKKRSHHGVSDEIRKELAAAAISHDGNKQPSQVIDTGMFD